MIRAGTKGRNRSAYHRRFSLLGARLGITNHDPNSIEPIALLYDTRRTRCGLRANAGGRLTSHKERWPCPRIRPAKPCRCSIQCWSFLLTTITGREAVITIPHGRHCLVGAVLHFSARHGLPRAPVM